MTAPVELKVGDRVKIKCGPGPNEGLFWGWWNKVIGIDRVSGGTLIYRTRDGAFYRDDLRKLPAWGEEG